MGTFSEVVLAFSFAADVQGEVVAAFGRWRDAEAPAVTEIRPPDPAERDALDAVSQDFFVTDIAHLSATAYAQVLADVVGETRCAYFPGRPSTVLAFDASWALTTRFVVKCAVGGACSLVAPLARYLSPRGTEDEPRFAGFVHGDGGEVLTVWDEGGELFAFRDARGGVVELEARPEGSARGAPATYRDLRGLIRFVRSEAEAEGNPDSPGIPTVEMLESILPADQEYDDDSIAANLRNAWAGTEDFDGSMVQHFFVLGPDRYRRIVDLAFKGDDPAGRARYEALAAELEPFLSTD